MPSARNYRDLSIPKGTNLKTASELRLVFLHVRGGEGATPSERSLGYLFTPRRRPKWVFFGLTWEPRNRARNRSDRGVDLGPIWTPHLARVPLRNGAGGALAYRVK